MIPDYWKFPKWSVLRLSSGILSKNIRVLPQVLHLPEDLYIFDETLQWTLITTHEYDKRNRRIFVHAGADAKRVDIH